MAKKGYSMKINEATVMLSGLRSQKEKLSIRGITDDYITKFGTMTDEAIKINSDQERSKASLMTLTKQLEDQLAALQKEIMFCKRVIMTEIPKEAWKEFGMIYRPRVIKTEEEKEEEKKAKESKKLSTSVALSNQGTLS